MLAQSSPAVIAQSAQDSTTPEQQASSLVTLVVQFLNSEGIAADAGGLSKRLQGVDIAKNDTQGIVSAISAHLVEDLKVDQARATEVLQKGQQVMSAALPSLGIDGVVPSAANGDATGGKLVNGTAEKGPSPPVKITDVRDFKAGLQVSRGPRAVKDLSEFEDMESKL